MDQFNKTPSNNLRPQTSINRGNQSKENIAAAIFAAEIGREIQNRFPGIATDYVVHKLTYEELISKYNIIGPLFGITNKQTARMAVLNAIHGYSGNLSASYQGLIINPAILQATAKEHQISGSKKVGEFTKNAGLGIFGRTEKEKTEDKRRGGVATLKDKKGIHADNFVPPLWSHEQRSEMVKKSNTTRGLTVLTPQAEAFIRSLDLSDPKYKYKARGSLVNVRSITEEVNSKFYTGNDKIRAKTIGSFLRRMKEQIPPIS